MKAAWYEKQGAARDVLVVDNMDDPQPRTGEVRIRIAFSGVNPGDVKKTIIGLRRCENPFARRCRARSAIRKQYQVHLVEKSAIR